MPDQRRLVYSTDEGRICPECQKPEKSCVCRRTPQAKGPGKPPAEAADGTARVRRETKGRGGKTVTTISGLPVGETRLQELAGQLKRRCGCGGSAKDGIILIQGDHADVIVQELQKLGFPAKRAGG